MITTGSSSKRAQFDFCHPILKRTLVFLSKLFRCLEMQVFQVLAQDAVSICTGKLLECSRLINKKKYQ